MWDFVVPEDETVEPVNTSSSAPTGVANLEYRPDRMGLGCSKEMIHEKISENAKKSRLTKLLKRKLVDEDGNVQTTSKQLAKGRVDSDDEEITKSSIVTKKVIAKPQPAPVHVAAVTDSSALSKSQKKRMKKKQKDLQKSLLSQ